MRLPAGSVPVVEAAALAHHFPSTIFNEETFDRLMSTMAGGDWRRRFSRQQLSDPLPAQVRAVLHAMRSDAEISEHDRQLAQIIDVANIFCEHIEFGAYEYLTVDQILDEIRALAVDDFVYPGTIHALANLPRIRRDDLADLAYRMPVFPATALRALDISSDEESITELELSDLAAEEPELAGLLLRVANSNLHSPAAVASIGEAIRALGMPASRKVLMTAVMRPFFLQTKDAGIWRHCLAMAQLAEQLALATGAAPPAEAFLAGLIHDAGRVAVDNIPGEAGALRQRMAELGCETTFAEKIVCRCDHGELGADILMRWNFPHGIIDAVKYHHSPELSEAPFASMLYLAEYWCGEEEDVPSAYRLNTAMMRTGITYDSLEAAGDRGGLLDSLISSAA